MTAPDLSAPPADAAAEQEALHHAVVRGEPLAELPQDLYIPPDALAVFLETFEGPLDLLLYLIRRQNLDILDIPIADITRQYMEYIEMMRDLQLELAAEYLVMAAMLAEIKSRMLLPRPAESEEEEEDPRAELVRRLQEYERVRLAAEAMDELPRVFRELHPASAEAPEMEHQRPLPQVELDELLEAFRGVLQRAKMFTHHQISREQLSVRERMTQILTQLQPGRFREFTALFEPREGRLGMVVTFMAVLELLKEKLIEISQSAPFAPIHVRPALHMTESDHG